MKNQLFDYLWPKSIDLSLVRTYILLLRRKWTFKKFSNENKNLDYFQQISRSSFSKFKISPSKYRIIRYPMTCTCAVRLELGRTFGMKGIGPLFVYLGQINLKTKQCHLLQHELASNDWVVFCIMNYNSRMLSCERWTYFSGPQREGVILSLCIRTN